jgi:hypothetical protein
MPFERGEPPETPNAPYEAARIKDERWRSAGPGFERGRAGARLSLTSSQDEWFLPMGFIEFLDSQRATPFTFKKTVASDWPQADETFSSPV